MRIVNGDGFCGVVEYDFLIIKYHFKIVKMKWFVEWVLAKSKFNILAIFLVNRIGSVFYDNLQTPLILNKRFWITLVGVLTFLFGEGNQLLLIKHILTIFTYYHWSRWIWAGYLRSSFWSDTFLLFLLDVNHIWKSCFGFGMGCAAHLIQPLISIRSLYISLGQLR